MRAEEPSLEAPRGRWVAWRNGVVVASAPTPSELVAALRSAGLQDTTIMRVADPEAPEEVGLG